MKKLNQETKDVVTIFGSVLIGICFTFFFGIVILHYSINNNDDVYNWTSLTIEIGIGIGITWTVWKFSKRDQDKIKELIAEIQKMGKRQTEIIEQQEQFRKNRERLVYHSLIYELGFLKMSTYERKRHETAIAENKPSNHTQAHVEMRTTNTINEIINIQKENLDVIPAEFMPPIKTILMFAKICNENHRWRDDDYLLFDEMKKEINILLEKLNRVHPLTVVQPYQTYPDWS
jgi:hypothetical protein